MNREKESMIKAANSRTISVIAFLAVVVMATFATNTRAQTVSAVMKEQAAANKAAAASQDRINKLRDEAKNAVDKQRQAQSEKENYAHYNEQLLMQVEDQNEKLDVIRGELKEIETTSRELLPLMQKMVQTLETFVALDYPFLIEERTSRIQSLKKMMLRSDVAISEKYRRILEAYAIEMEYGRTMDTYQGVLVDGSKNSKTVEFIRFGRISLAYRTLDGKETGYWDADKRAWIKDNSYAADVREAIRVAKRQGSPEMILLPISAARKVTK